MKAETLSTYTNGYSPKKVHFWRPGQVEPKHPTCRPGGTRKGKVIGKTVYTCVETKVTCRLCLRQLGWKPLANPHDWDAVRENPCLLCRQVNSLWHNGEIIVCLDCREVFRFRHGA